MPAPFLEGLRVIDIAGEPLAMTGRLLADLGAEVIKLEPPGGDPLRKLAPVHPDTDTSLRFSAWNAGKTCLEYNEHSAALADLLQGAQVLIETPGYPGALELPVEAAPNAIWLKATPFGLEGPRSHWRASDLGLLAAAGNLYATGFPDRPPVRCTEPAGYAHASAEAAFAILSGLATGKAQVIDLSMQECILIASMAGAGQFPKTGRTGKRMGAAMGRTREIWPCADGFVSFGLRGGPARAHNFGLLLEQMEREGIDCHSWRDRQWLSFDANILKAEELEAIETPLKDYFSRHTMIDLYELAVNTGLMLAPANSAEEILNSEQLASREFFSDIDGMSGFPRHAFIATDNTGEVLNAAPPSSNQGTTDISRPVWSGEFHCTANTGPSAWSGTRFLEFGSGAAGPIAGRYFAEQGASVIKVESRSRPDFLRVMASGSVHGLEGSTLFEALNPGKRSISLNLKTEEGRNIARQLMHWADAVIENFAPKVMKSCGLDYATMAEEKPDLVMLSTCLNGQTGPHRDYPGFGGQGAALAGYNYLTGWADREPVGPFGTITDSLSPRFASAALAAGLLYRRHTGKGVYFDIAQVETAAYSLAPWLLEHSVYGNNRTRDGNASLHGVPHGVFPCAGQDRWIAIACWSDDEWRALSQLVSFSNASPSLTERLHRRKEIEQELGNWTSGLDSLAVADKLQGLGIEAVPVADFADLALPDPQLAHRNHFTILERPITGDFYYERNGFRLQREASGIPGPAPLLGEHTQEILRDILGLTAETIGSLRKNGSIE